MIEKLNISGRLAALALCVAACGLVRGEETADAGTPGSSYVSAAAVLSLPQGGADMRRVGGAAARVGHYLNDFWAVEGTVGDEENLAVLGLGLVGHWSAWDLYDRFFGFSPFDPFVTVGATGWVGSGAGQVGPSAGLGAFYHLDDRWSLRADAGMTLGLDSGVEPVYTISAGVQYAF